jgi:hypothetical protein
VKRGTLRAESVGDREDGREGERLHGSVQYIIEEAAEGGVENDGG